MQKRQWEKEVGSTRPSAGRTAPAKLTTLYSMYSVPALYYPVRAVRTDVLSSLTYRAAQIAQDA